MMALPARQIARRLGLFFLPMVIVAMYCLALYVALDFDTFAVTGLLMILYLFTPIGKFILIPDVLLLGAPKWLGIEIPSLRELHGTGSPGLDIFLVAFSIAFVDAMTSLFLVYNFDILEAIPGLGKWLKKQEEKGKERLRKRAKREELAFVGLASFVALSVQGSGGISSTILGRIAGMRDAHIVGALFAGAMAGCTAIAVLSYYIGGQIIDSFGRDVLEIIGFAVLIGAIVYLIYYYSRE